MPAVFKQTLSCLGTSWTGPVVAILVLQTLAAFLMRLVPTVGPALMGEFGWADSWIGGLVAATNAGSMLVLLFGTPVIRRTGSIRSLQIGLGIGAASLALFACPVLLAPFAASVAIGFGHGIATPAGSDILQRFTPPGRRNLVFSIKQAGVPLGGVLAGAVLPSLIAVGGWRVALGFTAALVVAGACAVAPLRAGADRMERDSVRAPSGGPFRPAFGIVRHVLHLLRALSSAPGLWRLSVAGALLAIGQSCWFAFTVTYLVTRLDVSLTTAGLVFAVMQAAGVVGRIGFGWLSDGLGSGLPAMMITAILSAATTVALGLSLPGWPGWGLVLLACLAGLSVSGWNGVQIAEIARRSPPSLVSETAAGSTILIFVSNIIAPALFAVFVSATGRFDLAFFGVAASCLLSLAGLFNLERHARSAVGPVS